MYQINLNTITPEELVEEGVGLISVAMYRLMKADKHQQAYDELGTVIDFFIKDRQILREKEGVNW